jgi:hypothetical protein
MATPSRLEILNSNPASVSGSVYVSDNDSVLESPSQHESESIAEKGLDRCGGWSFCVGATFLVAVEVAKTLIAAGSEQLEEGEGVGEAIAMAVGGWACHHFE